MSTEQEGSTGTSDKDRKPEYSGNEDRHAVPGTPVVFFFRWGDQSAKTGKAETDETASREKAHRLPSRDADTPLGS